MSHRKSSQDRINQDVQAALNQRPELQRLKLLKDRAAVDLKLALNQFYPAANVGSSVTQDVGPSKKTFTGEDLSVPPVAA